MATPRDDLEGWKQRYYDAIGELEEREKQWGRVEQALRQGLSRLSLAADDSDATLNSQLEALRNDIRRGNTSEALQRQLGQISDSILRLDEARKRLDQLPSPAQLMVDIIGRIEFPHGMGHRARGLQKRLATAKPEECAAIGEEFASLIVESLQWSADHPDEGDERRGLLGKLFNVREREAVVPPGPTPMPDPVAKPAPTAHAPGRAAGPTSDLKLAKGLLGELIRGLVEDEGGRSALSARLQASAQEAELQRLAEELVSLLRGMGDENPMPDDEGLPVNEVLVRLLERLDIPAELAEEVAAVKAMLQQVLDASQVEQVIAAIAELIAEMRSRMQSEKAEIEEFLKQLTDRLQEIDSGFQENVASQRESYREGQALGEAVHVQVAGIEASVQQAEELAQLKQLVQQRVDTIRSHMQAFREAEDQRLAVAEGRVAELTARLERVQGESAQLRQRLHEERNQAMVDPLTGVPNRLAYNERLQHEFARWSRYGSPLSIAVWDVDRFKSINDTYGHQAGDKVLTVIAKLLHTKCRETDFVARFGGEEFVLLLPETKGDAAVVAAENLRKAVAATEFHFRGKRVPITISCGVSEFQQGDNPARVFARADKALYEAKNGGRNRCCKG